FSVQRSRWSSASRASAPRRVSALQTRVSAPRRTAKRYLNAHAAARGCSAQTVEDTVMELYLLRHGIAEDRNPQGDAARALTDEGRKKLRRVLERAAKAGVSPSLILSSPYKRALETAEIAAEILGYKKKIAHTDALLPEASPEAFWEEIRGRRQESAILAAGH